LIWKIWWLCPICNIQQLVKCAQIQGSCCRTTFNFFTI
jgi:hypothetical protein